MIDPVLQPNLGKEIKSLKDEIRQLRSYLTYLVKSNEESVLSVGIAPGGRLGVSVADSDGKDLVALGEVYIRDDVQPDHGLLVQDADGSAIFAATSEKGLLSPAVSLTMVRPFDATIVTTATFETVGTFTNAGTYHCHLGGRIVVGTDSDTVGGGSYAITERVQTLRP